MLYFEQLYMYSNSMSPQWNVSMMFAELQKSKAIVINAVISELGYLLIRMTGASHNILTGSRSGYCETPAQHVWVLFNFLYIKRKGSRKNKQTQRSSNLGVVQLNFQGYLTEDNL